MTSAPQNDTRLPVHVITGFLGSGKTTLLRDILKDPAFENTAVLINEFGEVGLDHLIAREVSEDVLLLDSGCLCCSAGDDLGSSLLDLLDLRRAGEADFERIVIETSGLADPGPIARLVMTDPGTGRHFRMGNVVTVIDGVNGDVTVQTYAEAQHQIAMSDAVLLSKEDLVPQDRLTRLGNAALGLNPVARLIDRAGLRDILLGAADGPQTAPQPDTAGTTSGHSHDHAHAHDHAHTPGMTSFVVAIKEPVDLQRFIRWLELLLKARGDTILRVKGLLAVSGETRPRVLQAVQTMVYPLDALNAWPDGSDGQTQIVVIGRHISAAPIERSLKRHVTGHATRRTRFQPA